jgi:hypothetical protein
MVEPELTPPPQKQVVLLPQFWKVTHSPGLVQAVAGVGVTVMVVVRVDGGRVVVVEVMLKQEQAEA